MIDPNPYNDKLGGGQTFLLPKDVVIFAPEFNSPGRKDATGAFHLGGEAFCEFYGIPTSQMRLFNNEASRNMKARQVLSLMERERTLNEETQDYEYPQVYVFFCHGWTSGIQAGFRSPTPGKPFDSNDRKNWTRFVSLVARHPAPIVVLYACSTGDDPDDDPDHAPGSGDDSFGDLLRDALCRRGCTYNRVVTHTTAGHTWRNPNIKLFDGNGASLGGVGGLGVARSGTKEFRVLAKMLKTKEDDEGYGFQWRFPFMTLADMHKEIVENMG